MSWTIMILILMSVAGGVFNRIRGGIFDLGSTTVGRLIGAMPLGAFVIILTGNWLLGALISVGLFIGFMPGWDPYARFPEAPAACAAFMALRGLVLFACPAVLSAIAKEPTFNPIWGSAMAIFYYLDHLAVKYGSSEYIQAWRKWLHVETLFGIYIYFIILYLLTSHSI